MEKSVLEQKRNSKYLAHSKQFVKCEKGAIAILTALILPVLIGFGALGYEVGYWYQSQQDLQQIADIASYGGANELSIRGSSGVTARSDYLASQNNFNAGSGSTITVNTPPLSGTHTKDPTAVEVLMTQTLQRSLTNFFSSSALNVSVRSVSALSGGPACIYVLDPSANGAMDMVGNATINSPSCGVYVNSSSPTALTGVGNTGINSDFVKVVGGSTFSGSGGVTTQTGGGIQTGASSGSNPLSSLQVPNYSACNFTGTNITKKGSVILSPGVYCGGVNITNGNVTLNPGTYIIDGGSFSLSGNANLSGSGVTIILSGKISGTYATLNLTGNGALSLTAPTSGTFNGIAVFQDPNAPSGGTNAIAGNGSEAITGAIYIPNQTLTYAGNGNNANTCVVLVVDKLTLVGNATLNCPAGSLGGLVTPSVLTLVE